MNRAIAIISDERVLDIPPFIRDIPDDKYHTMEIENFSMKHNLGITAESLGMQPGDYSGITWQKRITSRGYLVICFGDPIIAYIPVMLSLGQYNWLQDYKSFFFKNKKKLSYMVIGNEEEIIEKDDVYSANNSFQFMYSAVDSCRGRGILMQEESE